MDRRLKTEISGWRSEVHSESCYDDKDESSQVQEEKLQEQRRPGTKSLFVCKEIQRPMSCLCSVENSTSGFLQEARCEAGEGDSGVSGQRAGDNRMVRGSDGRAVASRTRSKERNCLHVGAEREVNCEHVQA